MSGPRVTPAAGVVPLPFAGGITMSRRPSTSSVAGTRVRACLARLFVLFALVSSATAGLAAGSAAPGPWSLQAGTGLLPLSRVDLVVMPAVDEEACRREDALAKEMQPDVPLRFAQPIEVDLTTGNAGTWETLADGARIWRLRIVSPGAKSLNFGFARYRLPEGARLHLFAAPLPGERSDGDSAGAAEARRRWPIRGPHGAADANSEGGFWSAIVPGDDAVIELWVPREAAFDPELRIAQVNHDYLGFGTAAMAGIGADAGPASGDPSKQGSCNNDVICPEGDPWRAEIRSVAVYTLSGAWTCTGTLLNSHAPARPPLFLTANHCAISESNDGTMVIYWNFESPTCGQLGGGSLAQSQNGGVLLAKSSTSDFCLVRLEETPDEAFNVYYAGWDAREETRPASAVGIHHPNCDEKAISFTNSALAVTSYLQDGTPGDGTHWRVIRWHDGTTEPGSSGSGIWDEDRRIVGQLHGGSASCEQPEESDWYGRLSRSWTGGGASGNRLQDHLDPEGTGVRYIDGFDPSGGGPLAGDANVDGVVNVQDLVAIVNHILALATLSTEGAANADLNADTRISVLDVVLVVNILLGKEVDTEALMAALAASIASVAGGEAIPGDLAVIPADRSMASGAEAVATSGEIEAALVELEGRPALRLRWDESAIGALDLRLAGTLISPAAGLETLECAREWQGVVRTWDDGSARIILYNLGRSGQRGSNGASDAGGTMVEAWWPLPAGLTRLAQASIEASTPAGALAATHTKGFPIVIGELSDPAHAADLLRFDARPNPAAGAWRVELELRRPAGVELLLFDAAGRQQARRAVEPFGAGVSVVAWDPRAEGIDLPAGVYFLRALVDGSPARTAKVLTIR